MVDDGESSMSSAIPDTVRKPSDVTRQVTQKLRFIPTLPTRRKKEYAIRAIDHS
ncbi:hypothetical protein J3R83DRAFT_6022 [Lanmaoa asiatica]|nr:hypothetical protein J3R83DRAFT_6022 [Lanmaoa asiatica]